MQQHYFDVPFAFSGDVTAIPDPLQVGGTVSFTEGWNFNYQRDLTTDPAALPIDRSTMNWLFLQITMALQALQNTGVPEWITAANNGGTAKSYGNGSVVLYSAAGTPPFVKYVSLIDSNTVTPGTDATKWQVVADAIATSAQASAGTDNTTIMTPLRVAAQTALRALLAGSASQVFNVADASANTHALSLQQAKGRLLNVQVFNAAGATTYTPTPGTSEIIVDVVGGGGGGGGTATTGASQAAIGSGGASGSRGVALIPASTFGASVAITIGAAGAFGGANGNGGAGGQSSFGAFVVAPGGGGGAVGLASAAPFLQLPSAPGGAATFSGTLTQLINCAGNPGTMGACSSIANGAISGGGGHSPQSGGGGGRAVQANSAGQLATSNGAGGGGAALLASQAGTTGGPGSAGKIIVYEYGTAAVVA